MERHFRCTACGKCCAGWLPLTVKDALAHAHLFPLAMVWTPIRQASKAFALTARLGTTVRTADKKTVAVRIAPTAYIPPTMACPALTSDNLCGLQADKPSRCRAMPFFAYREENDQRDLLVPRPGWECDVTASAPAVYRAKQVLEREDFDHERTELLAQSPLLRNYADRLMSMVPSLPAALANAANKPGGGHVAVSFASLLRRLDGVDKSALAQAQHKVLTAFGERVEGQTALAEYARNYADWAWELERLL